MQAHIWSLHAPSVSGIGSKVITFFLKLVMLHVKLERNRAQSTMQAHILSFNTPSVPGVGSKGKTFLFFIELSTEKIVDQLLTMIYMNSGVRETGCMFCDLYVSLK